MRALLFLLIAFIGFSVLLGGVWVGIRALYPEVYRRWGKKALVSLPIIWALGMLTSVVARTWLGANTVAHVAVAVSASVVVLLVCLIAPLVVGVAMQAFARQVTPEPDPSTNEGPTRRELLVGTARVIPAVGVGAAVVGGIEGLSGAHLNRIELTFPNLPEDLEGFSILHYTDMHLGTFIDLFEVERLVELGRGANADLVVLTGDMADDLDGLLPALRRFESLDPPHGVAASIGNHEYFRGIKKSLVTYAKTGVEMFVEKGTSIRVGASTLYIGGADDPRVLRGDKMAFMERTVNNALDGAPSDAFRLLLSHRPEGFIPAAKAGFDLTLSGHTHGAQLGFDGRSWLESFMPDRYMWGAYSAGDKRLYTSSGAGHWFPFRLGCPREVPLIVLKRGPAATDAQIVRIG